MYLVRLVLLQISIFALSETRILPGEIQFSEEEKAAIAIAQEFCKSKTVSFEEYPYHAVVISACPYQLYGVIISDRYVITGTDPSSIRNRDDCRYMVQVGSDTNDIRVAFHDAKIFVHGDISIFELERPIEFGSRAQKIEIANEVPKSGDQALITKLTQDFLPTTQVYAYNVTVLSDQGCMKVISNPERGPLDNPMCKGSLWADYPKLPSAHPSYGYCRGRNVALVDGNGRLVGIEDYKAAFGLEVGRQIDSFVDLSLHKATINKYLNKPN